MSAVRHLLILIGALIAGLIGLNLLAGAWLDGVRADFTAGGLYRISPAAGAVLDDLGEPVRLEFVYSRRAAVDIAPVRAHAARVRELLRSMEARADGRLIVVERDPEPFSPAEDEAIRAGLEPVETASGEPVFLGLIGRNAVDETRVIAFLDPAADARLEYDLVELVATLDRGRPPRLAILTSLPLQSLGEPHPLTEALSRRYTLEWVDRDFEALPDADALLVIHPAEPSPEQSYLLDQFVLSRGRALFVADPLAHLAIKPDATGLAPLDAVRGSDLGVLGPAWGVRIDASVVAMDRDQGLAVQIVEDGRTRTRSYPLWFSVPPAGISDALPATTALSRGVNLGSPGVITALEEGPLSVQPLLETGGDGARLDIDIARRSPGPGELLEAYAPAEDAPLMLAARLSGVAVSAFPDGPPAGDTALEPGAHRTRSDGPVEIIVLADADLIDPSFFLSGDGSGAVADNLDLVLNLVDALAGDRALMGLRARPDSRRPMTRVETMRAQAEARYERVAAELRDRLSAAEAELAALEASGSASALAGADADAARAAARLRETIVEAREDLRDVERGLRREIDALKQSLVFWTMWVPPLLVILSGIAALWWRRRPA